MKSTLAKLLAIIITTTLGLSLFTFTPIAYADDSTNNGFFNTNNGANNTNTGDSGGNTGTGDVCSSDAADIVKQAAGCSGNDDALPNYIISILNGIIAVSGLVAVIYVVIGGITYMTSTGDSQKLEKAKKTILYACIGMAVAVLAFAFVNFVIINIIGGGSSNTSNSGGGGGGTVRAETK
ncbi:hypothetical protein IKF30_00890 [Candidatus Saccharibacteria bacterium]|nr:hypothetical protein [Candidatus Saccharibacteria bacterium]